MLPFSTLSSHISSPIRAQFENHSERHILACDLEIRARRMAGCFANITGTLPLPDNSMRNVWNLLPNDTRDKMSTPLKAGAVFPSAPPPTPMDMDFAVIDGSSPRARSDNFGLELIYETRSPTPDTAAFGVALGTCVTDDVLSNPASEACSSKVDEQALLENDKSLESASPLSNEDYSCLSDAESGQSESLIFSREFEEIAKDKIKEVRVRGVGFVAQSLLAIGAQTVQSAPVVSMVVQVMLCKMAKGSATQAESFKKALRVGASEVFRRHWKLDGDWRHICSTSDQHSALTLTGINKAGLMGSLFCAKVVTAEDIALCLSMLLEEIHFDRLCAMHAILLHADDRLCKTRNLPALKQFKERLLVVNPVSDTYIWAPAPHARALLQDILDIIEGWIAMQAIKRKRYHESYLSRKQLLVKVVGPRLRQGRGINCST